MKNCSPNYTQTTLTHTQMQEIQDDYEKNYHNIPFECSLTPLGVELFQKNNYPNMKLTVNITSMAVTIRKNSTT